jgi:hypothetical protein
MGLLRSRAWLAAAFLFWGLVASGLTLAQVPEQAPPDRPIPAGPFEIYPLFSSRVERTDNLFYSSTAPVSTTVTTVTPGLLAQLAVGQSQLRLGYTLRYRDYRVKEIPTRFSHFLRADGEFNFSRGLVIGFVEDYQRGVLDTETFDPGGEITFLGDKFESNSTEVELGYRRGTRQRVRFSAQRSTIRFDRAESRNLFYDSDFNELRLSGEHRMGKRFWLLWSAQTDQEDLERPSGEFEDRREEQGVEARLGARMRLSPGSSLRGSVGWRRSEFDLEDENSVDRSFVGSVDFTRAIPAGASFNARLSQGVYTSLFTSYYESTQLSLRLVSASAARVSIGASLRYTRNDYPEGDFSRKDTIVGGETWVGYRFGGSLEWRVFANVTSRSSAEPAFEYDVRRFGTTLRLGG